MTTPMIVLNDLAGLAAMAELASRPPASPAVALSADKHDAEKGYVLVSRRHIAATDGRVLLAAAHWRCDVAGEALERLRRSEHVEPSLGIEGRPLRALMRCARERGEWKPRVRLRLTPDPGDHEADTWTAMLLDHTSDPPTVLGRIDRVLTRGLVDTFDTLRPLNWSRALGELNGPSSERRYLMQFDVAALRAMLDATEAWGGDTIELVFTPALAPEHADLTTLARSVAWTPCRRGECEANLAMRDVSGGLVMARRISHADLVYAREQRHLMLGTL